MSYAGVDLRHVEGACGYCSTQWLAAIHPVGSAGCRVRVIEYYPDGTVKRVEFRDLDTATQTRTASDYKVTFSTDLKGNEAGRLRVPERTDEASS